MVTNGQTADGRGASSSHLSHLYFSLSNSVLPGSRAGHTGCGCVAWPPDVKRARLPRCVCTYTHTHTHTFHMRIPYTHIPHCPSPPLNGQTCFAPFVDEPVCRLRAPLVFFFVCFCFVLSLSFCFYFYILSLFFIYYFFLFLLIFLFCPGHRRRGPVRNPID